MNKRILAAAAALLLAVPLAACGRTGQNLAKMNSEFFKYSFGEDAALTYVEEVTHSDGSPVGCGLWKLTYTDDSGVQHESDVELYDYTKDVKEDGIENKQAFVQYQTDAVMCDELKDNATRRLYDEVFDPILGTKGASLDKLRQDLPEGGTAFVFIYPIVYGKDDNPKLQAMIDARNTPGTGWRACGDALKTMAEAKEAALVVNLEAPEDADIDAWEKKLDQIAAAYLEAEPNAQNFQFVLKQQQGEEKSKTVAVRTRLMGETLDLSLDDLKEESYSKRITKALAE